MKSVTINSLCISLTLLLILYPCLISAYINTVQSIREFDKTGACWLLDPPNWSATSNMTATLYYYCSGSSTYLMGGYGILGSLTAPYSMGESFFRKYTGVPSHLNVHFSFTLYALDAWDSPSAIPTIDSFNIGLDATVIPGFHVQYTAFTEQLCGSTAYDLRDMRVFGTWSHTGTTLTFKLISNLYKRSDQSSFGFRDLAILFDGNAPSNYVCALAAIPLTGGTTCPCAEGSYWTGSVCTGCHGSCSSCYAGGNGGCITCALNYGWVGTYCTACSTGCETCNGGGYNQCYSCQTGYYYYAAGKQCLSSCPYAMVKSTGSCGLLCDSRCAPTDFVYWDGSCNSTCASRFPQSSTLSALPNSVPISTCIYPCSSTEYLYWDGNCLLDCQAPLVITTFAGRNLCNHPCATTSHYLYNNGTCDAACPSYLISRTILSRNLCLQPCNYPSDYIYWDGSCYGSCPTPYISTTLGGANFCDFPCATTSFLYYNGTCKTTCVFPLSTRYSMGRLFCDLGAVAGSYLYWDGTSSLACSSPLYSTTDGVINYCNYPCNMWEWLYFNGSCNPECQPPLTQRSTNGRQYCDFNCPSTSFLYFNGSCATTCNMPMIQVTSGGKKFCNFPDGDVTLFVFYDRTFAATCPSPMFSRIEGSPLVRKYCDNTCTTITDYLYFNGSCASTCGAPFIPRTIGGRKTCNFVCNIALGEYMYYDTTCNRVCDAPLIQRTTGGAKFCDYPCADTSYFVFHNGTCSATCPPPLKQLPNVTLKWCVYPCSETQFLLADGTCVDSCSFPYTSVTELNLKYCRNLCPNNKYLFWDGTCVDKCVYPSYVIPLGNGKGCRFPCIDSRQYWDEYSQSCINDCPRPSTAKIGAYLTCPIFITDDSSILDVFLAAPSDNRYTLVHATRLSRNIKYMNVSFPPRLQKLALSKGSNILSIRWGSAMSDSIVSAFPKSPVPSVFDRNGIHSHFVVNFWREITSWMIAALAALVFSLLFALSKRQQWRKATLFFEKMKTLTRWNFLLALVGSSVPEIVLYASIEFKTYYQGAPFSALSIELAIIGIVLSVSLGMGVIFLGKEYKKCKAGSDENWDYLARWGGFQAIFRGFRGTFYPNRFFYAIYMVRLAVPSVITAYWYTEPLGQSIVYLWISIAITAYLIKYNPIIDVICRVQLLLTELLQLFMNVCLVLLVFMDRAELDDTRAYVVLGDLILISNAGTNFMFCIVFLVKFFWAIKGAASEQSGLFKKDIFYFTQALVVIIQQGAFGFECINVDPLTEIPGELPDSNRPLLSANGSRSKYFFPVVARSKVMSVNESKSKVSHQLLQEESPLPSPTSPKKGGGLFGWMSKRFEKKVGGSKALDDSPSPLLLAPKPVEVSKPEKKSLLKKSTKKDNVVEAPEVKVENPTENVVPTTESPTKLNEEASPTETGKKKLLKKPTTKNVVNLLDEPTPEPVPVPDAKLETETVTPGAEKETKKVLKKSTTKKLDAEKPTEEKTITPEPEPVAEPEPKVEEKSAEPTAPADDKKKVLKKSTTKKLDADKAPEEKPVEPEAKIDEPNKDADAESKPKLKKLGTKKLDAEKTAEEKPITPEPKAEEQKEESKPKLKKLGTKKLDAEKTAEEKPVTPEPKAEEQKEVESKPKLLKKSVTKKLDGDKPAEEKTTTPEPKIEEQKEVEAKPKLLKKSVTKKLGEDKPAEDKPAEPVEEQKEESPKKVKKLLKKSTTTVEGENADEKSPEREATPEQGEGDKDDGAKKPVKKLLKKSTTKKEVGAAE